MENTYYTRPYECIQRKRVLVFVLVCTARWWQCATHASDRSSFSQTLGVLQWERESQTRTPTPAMNQQCSTQWKRENVVCSVPTNENERALAGDWKRHGVYRYPMWYCQSTMDFCRATTYSYLSMTSESATAKHNRINDENKTCHGENFPRKIEQMNNQTYAVMFQLKDKARKRKKKSLHNNNERGH